MLEAVLAGLDAKGAAHQELASAWDRVATSIGDADELAYCKVSGKLGLDPYDPASPENMTEVTWNTRLDIRRHQDEVPRELLPTTEWLANAKDVWRRAPQIDVAAFGDFQMIGSIWLPGRSGGMPLTYSERTQAPMGIIHEDIWSGYGNSLRNSASFSQAPASIAALVARNDTGANIATVARSAREQR